MNSLAYVLLPLFLALLLVYIRKDIKEYEHFKQLSLTQQRQRKYRDWLIKSFILFGLGSLLALVLLGHIKYLFSLFPPFATLLPEHLLNFEGFDETFIGLITGLLMGGLFIGVAFVYFLRKKVKDKASFVVGDIEALLPRNAKERFWAALLSINAGFSEELFFRLLLPILFFLVSNNAILAFTASILIFGLVHYYQGWAGVAATSVLGAVFSALYLMTGNIFLVMGIHALIDLNNLLFQPWLRARLAGV